MGGSAERPLFNGSTLSGWHAFHQTTPVTNWRVVDGTIMTSGPGPDLVTDELYGNFELSLDWKIWPGGNSGIIYRVDDGAGETYETGPEMQVLDDARHADGESRLTAAGSLYGIYPAPAGIVHPAGEWNSARLRVNGSHVEHWLNGTKMVEYELASPDWERRVAASKFKAWKGYGRFMMGRIALQDHGDTVAYRNIRIRALP